MAESSRRFRKSTSRSIAASSAIALALGGISVVGPGPLAPSATAAEFSGGVRDKSGAVEKDAQQASDLPAGSCVVSEINTANHSQAGFSWTIREPNNEPNSDKTLWGLSVSFDNSKDRTFADWSFTNTANLGTLLDLGEVPSMEADQTFLGKSVTHRADESIVIDGTRQQRNLNLLAELTADEVKQFASATADNPVRYAWQGHYTKDHSGNLYATRGGSSTFSAVVNPWPSENIECNPITVSWENWKKHVIVPGDETKVGTVNIPTLQNDDGGGTDDSMSRMVVEAYDGNGKFIGTTDPSVSGGEKLLRVDEKTGEIFFTWPEYRGTDLATDKNVNFSVLAKPRTVDQLQAAVEHNNFGAGSAFDSSNSLDRYSKANVIDSKVFSLDDTEYHDPKYDKTDASIISGVDSATGPLATEQQKVTFTQVPDLIKGLMKDKGDGGFEAKVSLDEKYVYEGWNVEMDGDYNVTVTAPENPKPGTFARPVVTVEYSNGSTDRLEMLVVVDPNNTQVTDLVRPGLTKGTIGDDLTAQVGTKSIMKGHKPVHPAKFEIDESTVPEGWTVTVDETGKVTAKADDTVAPGTIITPTVKATYPDETTDEIETQFQAIVDIKVPDYDTVTNKPGHNVTLSPTLPERGLSGNTTDEAPKRYTFEDGKTEYTHTDDSGTWTVKIDENTGEITTTIPRTAPEGYILNVPVLAYYDNADKPQQVKGTVVVLKGDIAPTYDVRVTGPDTAVNHEVQDAPKGSKFSFGKNPDGSPITEQEIDGWKYTIDQDTGVVSSTPPADSKPGDKKTVTVTVQTPDGSTPEVPVTTVVKLTNNWEAEPTVPPEKVFPGGTASSPVTVDRPEGINLAEGKPFNIVAKSEEHPNGLEPTGETNEFGNPTYKVATENGDWIVGLDDDRNVISTAPKTARPGDKINVPVTVTYEDGSTDTTTAVVTVEDFPERPKPFDVEYKYDAIIPAGEYKVETEGEPGMEKLAYDENGEEIWKETEAPVNEVVLIGIKPAENTEDLEWTAPIPYSTTLEKNPDLAPGEIKVIQEGVNGERNYTAKFRSVGDESYVVTSEDTKEPVEKIIQYGPGIDDQTLTSTTTNPVPFNTKFVADDTLAAGEQVVEKQGVNGVDTITSTQEIKDGKPVGEPTISTERTTEPQDAVIRVGTKTTGENTETVESEIPFGVKVEFDPNMPAGTSESVTEGKPGKKTVMIERDITNSTPGEPNINEEVVEEPVDQVIKVGTKPSEASEKVTWTSQVPFEVETRPNPELKPGEIKVAQKGVPGEKTYTADFAAKGTEATVTPEEKQTKDPVNEIIEYGPAPEDTSVVTKVEKPVPFETEIVFDDTLAEGEQVVDQQGEHGTEVVTSTQQIVDGKPSGEPTTTTEQTKAPTKQIIRVGTKTAGQTMNSVESEIPFPTRIVYDPTLAPGEQKVTQEGKPGTKKVTVTQPVENSEPNGEATSTEEILEEPTEQIIAVGTKPDEATGTIEWTAPVPFNTEVKPNSELKPGEVKVVTEGVLGEKKYTADFSSEGSDATVTPTEKQTKDPVDALIEYGPTIADQTLTSTKTREVAFETEFVVDDTLPAGTQVVDKQGEKGEELITSTQEIKDGKPSGEPTITTEETKAPTKAIIRVGSMTDGTHVVEEKQPIPFDTVIEYDPTIPVGEHEVATEGKPGEKTTTITQTIVNSKVTDSVRGDEKVTSEPVAQVIKVGTKQADVTATDNVEWTEPIPFKTVLRSNPKLAPGEIKTVQEGKDGEVTYTAAFTATNGEASTTEEKKRTEPVEEIIEYSSPEDHTLTTTEDKPLPFETEIIWDDTLPAGEQQVEQQGEIGLERITSTQEIKDSKPVGEPSLTTERVKEPKRAIIRIGTKKPASVETSTDVEVPFNTEVQFDETLEPGEEVEVTPGKPGVVRVVTVGDETVVETVEEAQPRIIKVGSKPGEMPTWKNNIPFNVITRENPDLPAGTHNMVQEGKAGLARHIGDEVEILEAPQDAIVEVGTGIDEGQLRNIELSQIQFETEIYEDDSLPAGSVQVDQQGGFGTVRTTKTWTFSDGKVQGEPAVTTEELSKPQDLIIRVGTKVVDTDPENAPNPVPSYDPELVKVGDSVKVGVHVNHTEGNAYEVGENVPEGWTVDVDPATGELTVTPPADAKTGDTAQIPVKVTTADGQTFTVTTVVGVLEGVEAPEDETPAPKPDIDAEDDAVGSSDKAKRCVTNAFSKNSPILWLLPVGLLAGIGYGVNEAFGPQIQQVSAEVNARFQQAMPKHDWGHGRRGHHFEQPEWARELQAKANAVNRQFAGYGEQLQPLGIALGAVAAISLTGVLIAQACQEEGFDNGMTVLGSTERVTSSGETRSSSSEGSSENSGSSSK